MSFSNGPWTVEYAGDGSPYIEAPDGSVCNVGPYCGDRHGWVPEEQDIYNARLIAAAPDMVAMLLRVRRELGESSLKDALDAMLAELPTIDDDQIAEHNSLLDDEPLS